MVADLAQESATPRVAAGAKRILLVDDDRDLTEMIREYLEPEGFAVDVATVPAKLDGAQYQKLQKGYYPCKHEFELKPGKYALRLGAADRTGHAIGTLLTHVTVN